MLVDLDVFGRGGRESAAAISNAMLLYVGCNRGDYLYEPGVAGEVSRKLFKLSSRADVSNLLFEMEQALMEAFSAYVSDVTVEAGIDGAEWEFRINWFDHQSEEAQSIEFKQGLDVEVDYGHKQVEILYTGDNLLAFVLLQDVGEAAERLEFGWRWGRFDLVALRESDPRFSEIMAVIG